MSIIAAALDFIHARKWLVELILAAVIAGAIYAYCQHLIELGVHKERAVWVNRLAEQQRQADIELGRKQGLADAAEKANAKAQSDLADYVRDHPLGHGGLCQPPKVPGLSSAAAHSVNEGATPGPDGVQPLSSGNTGSGRKIDQRGLLDSLGQRADRLSAQVGEWQAR